MKLCLVLGEHVPSLHLVSTNITVPDEVPRVVNGLNVVLNICFPLVFKQATVALIPSVGFYDKLLQIFKF